MNLRLPWRKSFDNQGVLQTARGTSIVTAAMIEVFCLV